MAQDGGLISSLTLGEGNGGNVFINARNSVEVTNSTELINSGQFYVPSYLTSQSFGNGNAGNLTINTPTFVVGNKAFANTSTQAFGDAGTLNINAFDLEVSGSVGSSATKANTETQQYFGAPPVPSGSPGEVNINAGRLSLINGGQVSVTNEGISTVGGKLAINADSVSLDNKSSITASTASGVGGDIQLNAIDLFLNNKSTITASADNKGNGGNITINADILTGSKNSSINADAFEARGGNITINAQGLFFSPDSLITASSKYGINGTVKYSIADTNISPPQLKAEGILIAPEITSACQAQVGTGTSSLVVSTRNLQSQPNDLMYNNVEQSNSVPVPAFNNSHNPKSLISNQSTQIIEANVLIRDSQGNFVLTTDQANPTWDNASLSASSCFSGSQ
ncbi:S-layer family protein [Nostoc sp. 'Peltigera membranacea cyanobiont' 232]|uniref:S-layer family protein n=1 Tax=Nostoc sp. 'Peltigera membranacea cyanobiont' 232 TaxID=2014531 RepID=UPI000B9593A1|nr:S-layer family protein [Nostoc sp. 'Peltigera membranacea cyanobiont' 232]OYD99794.1 hypothetical protein CDG79_38865 [Nostoc sp. 'Peltigera membranacea cyanobiont' 232]